MSESSSMPEPETKSSNDSVKSAPLINVSESPLESLEEVHRETVGIPNGICPEKPVQNIHYLSSFNEFASVQLKKTDTDEDVVNFYGKYFPKEAKEFQAFIKAENEVLGKSSGMASGGTIMRIGSIPEFIRVSMQYLHGLDYWNKSGSMTRFVRRFKGFMVGDHSVKDTSGIIIK